MAGSEDGFGQSFRDDLRYLWRFRHLRRRAVAWERPSPAAAAMWDEDPITGRFGDYTIAVTWLDGRALAVRARVWFGWPDPPEYVLFAREADGTIWCAHDFGRWPNSWTIAGGDAP